MTAHWTVEVVRDLPSVVHALPLPDPPSRSLRVVQATAPALVLGSTQRMTDVAVRREGVEIVTRRSGGGAVFVTPGDVLWVDVFVPAGDPLWEEDVGRSFHWLGDVWAETVGGGATVHRGAFVRTPLASKVCFAGLGPGEVTVDGRKVVGIAQRRTRALALFQCACLLRWDPAPLAEMLGLDPVDLAPLAAPAPRSTDELTDVFVEALAAATGGG